MQYADFFCMSLFQTIYCTCRNVCDIGAPVITKQDIPKWTASTSENTDKANKDTNYLVTWIYFFKSVCHEEKIKSLYWVAVPPNNSPVA